MTTETISASHDSLGFNSDLVVKTKTHGVGVFATRSFRVGKKLTSFDAEFVEFPTKYTIQVEDGRHLVTEGNLGAFLNHSCDPNTRFVAESLEMTALKPIQIGDEVTFNYLSSEWDMASPFQCQCGSARCHGDIRGFRHLSQDQKKQLSHLVLPYLLRLK